MSNFRVKNPTYDPDPYKCCFCCNIKIGTILYGFFCLVINIFVLSMMLLLIPLAPPRGGGEKQVEFDGIHMEDEKPRRSGESHFSEKRLAYVAVLLCILVTILLLYGVIMTRPGYIIPFLCQHVFLFCLSFVMLVGYATYMFDIKLWIVRNGLSHLPGMDRVMTIHEDYLKFFTMTVLILGFCSLAYLISMIWACYKYVQESVVVVVAPPLIYKVDPELPKYEDVIKYSPLQ